MMTLSDQLNEKERRAAQAAADKALEARRLYPDLLARDAMPRKGDAEALAACMTILGKSATDVAEDLRLLKALASAETLAKEIPARELAASAADLAHRRAEQAVEVETDRLHKAVEAAGRTARLTGGALTQAERARDRAGELRAQLQARGVAVGQEGSAS